MNGIFKKPSMNGLMVLKGMGIDGIRNRQHDIWVRPKMRNTQFLRLLGNLEWGEA